MPRPRRVTATLDPPAAPTATDNPLPPLIEDPPELVDETPAPRTNGRATRHRSAGADYGVPQDAEFGDTDYLPAPGLERIGDSHIHHMAEFAHLHDAAIVFLWKRKGGGGRGRETLGKCQKPSGLLLHFAECTFVIWCAADHVRMHELTLRQVEALVYHELCHATVKEDPHGERTWVTAPHDVEAFTPEIRRYGLWKEDLQHMGAAVLQLELIPTTGQ